MYMYIYVYTCTWLLAAKGVVVHYLIMYMYLQRMQSVVGYYIHSLTGARHVEQCIHVHVRVYCMCIPC